MGRWMGALAVLAVMVFAACGEGDERLSRDEYAKRVTALGDRAGRNYGLFEAESGPEVRAAVSRLREAQIQSADELERIRPPEDAEEAHELLIEGQRGLAADLAKLEKRVGRDPFEIVVVSQTIQGSPGSGKIREAVEELRRLGYIESSPDAPGTGTG